LTAFISQYRLFYVDWQLQCYDLIFMKCRSSWPESISRMLLLAKNN